jgi:hypothetical protein
MAQNRCSLKSATMTTDLSASSRYSIHDLATLASLATRTVRFYIA